MIERGEIEREGKGKGIEGGTVQVEGDKGPPNEVEVPATAEKEQKVVSSVDRKVWHGMITTLIRTEINGGIENDAATTAITVTVIVHLVA